MSAVNRIAYDRATVVARTIVHQVQCARLRGLAGTRAQIEDLLRAEFADAVHQAITDIRLSDE
jgi:hypothetical protein